MPFAVGWAVGYGVVAAAVAAGVGLLLLDVRLGDRGRPVRVTVSLRESSVGGDTELFWQASMGNGRTLVLHRFGVIVEGDPEPLYIPAHPLLGRQLPAPLAAKDKLRVGTYAVEVYRRLVDSDHGAQDVSLVAFFEDGGGARYKGGRLHANATTRRLRVASAS